LVAVLLVVLVLVGVAVALASALVFCGEVSMNQPVGN
jgi:hypothetical protein